MDRGIIDYYDTLAPNYDADRFGSSYGRFLDAQERTILEKYLPRDDARVLDLGCGIGRLCDFAGGLHGASALDSRRFRHWRWALDCEAAWWRV